MTLIMIYLTRKYEKEKIICWLNRYCYIKTIINIILSSAVVKFVTSNIECHRYINIILIIMLFILISTFDSYLVFKKIKSLRQLEVSGKTYVGTYIRNSLIWIIIAMFAFRIKDIAKDYGDLCFILVVILALWRMDYFMPYIIMMTNKTVENIELRRILRDYDLKSKLKIYTYEGKETKSANAVVVGTCINRHIFISDYYIEQATEEEVLAILYHECGHIKNHDLEKRNIYINFMMVLFFGITYGMDFFEDNYAKISIPVGICFLLAFAIGVVMAFRRMQRNQELKADEFAVKMIGDENLFIQAIEKMYSINDMMKKNSTLISILSTHPQIEMRVKNIAGRDINSN